MGSTTGGRHSASPSLSVILITPERYDSLRKTIGHLRSQSVHQQMEIVIVTARGDAVECDESELRDFHSYQVVEIGPVNSVGRAWAAGIRGASAPIAVLGEDHSFPEPGWAEALLRAHQQDWAVVGPVVRNANPATLMSWADYFLGYGPWQDPSPAGEREHLPGHNSSYKRDILLQYGCRLESMMEAESVLHWDLRRNGYRLWLEPASKTRHVNFTRLRSWIAACFQAGRKFAGFRADNEKWPRARRLLFGAASPLIPFVRYRRIAADSLGHGRSTGKFLAATPWLLFGLGVDAAGQMMGSVFGAGTAQDKLMCFEFQRYRHVRARDRESVFHN